MYALNVYNIFIMDMGNFFTHINIYIKCVDIYYRYKYHLFVLHTMMIELFATKLSIGTDFFFATNIKQRLLLQSYFYSALSTQQKYPSKAYEIQDT